MTRTEVHYTFVTFKERSSDVFFRCIPKGKPLSYKLLYETCILKYSGCVTNDFSWYMSED